MKKNIISITSFSFIVMAVVLGSVFMNNRNKTAPDNKPVHERNMCDNGLEVVVLDKKNSHILTLLAVFEIKSEYLTSQDNGKLHMVEHLLIDKYRADINRLGCIVNGTTNQDYMIIEFNCSEEDWKEGIDIFCNMINPQNLLNSDFSGYIENEKNIVIKELELKSADISSELWKNMDLARNGYNILGDVGSIAEITNADMIEMIDRHLFTDRTLITVIGDMSNKDILDKIQESYGASKYSYNQVNYPTERVATVYQDVIRLPVTDCGDYVPLILVWEGPDMDSEVKETFSADVLCGIINNSELFIQPVRENEYVKNYKVYYQPARLNGQIIVSAVADSSHVKEAAKRIQDAITNPDIYKQITEDMLKQSKTLIQSDWILYQEDTKEFEIVRSKIWSMADLRYADSYIENINSVTKEDILHFVDSFIIQLPPTVGWVEAAQ